MISHLNKKNQPQLVNIENKKITLRTAIAYGEIKFSKKTFNQIQSYKTKKGGIKNIAIIAGILGAKKTSDLIPLCHNILLEDINIDIKINKKKSTLEITSSVKSKSKTGVEMEALTAVSISCLTIYDMCKGIDKNIVIKNICLLKKTGGKTDFMKTNK